MERALLSSMSGTKDGTGDGSGPRGRDAAERKGVYGKGPGDGEGQGLYAGSNLIDQSQPWQGRMWFTTTAHTSAGPCACPSGCSDCVYRSPVAYNNTNVNYRPLYNGSTPTSLLLGTRGVEGGGGGTFVQDGPNLLESCPAVEELVCVTCDNTRGYYPAVYAGHFTSEAGVSSTGSGFTCIYVEKCATLSSACGINFTFVELFQTVGVLFLFFLALFGIYSGIRRFKYMLYTCDPNLYIEENNPNYPPIRRPPELKPGQFTWLSQAWHATDTDLIKAITTDELMLLRWFRVVYYWFFGGTLFCAPVLMTLYFIESRLSSLSLEDEAVLGLKRVTIATVETPWVFWVVVVEMWLLSIWLVYLLGRETKKYAQLCWRLPPARVGIKSRAIIVNDIPMLTTEPMPESVLKRTHESSLMSALNTALPGRYSARSSISPRSSVSPESNIGLGEERQEESGLNFETTVNSSLTSGKVWLKRNFSQFKDLIDFKSEDITNLRAYTGDEIEAAVKDKMESVFGQGCVVQCILARDTRQIDKLAGEWHAVDDRYKQALIAENNLIVTIKDLEEDLGGANTSADDGGESGGLPPHITAQDREDGAKFKNKLNTLRRKLTKTKKLREALGTSTSEALLNFNAARSDYLQDLTPSPSAVVLFGRQMDAVIASQVQFESIFGRWHTDAAPGPNDLVWHNLALTSQQRFRKNMRARAIAFIMVLFFMVPVNGLVWIVSKARNDIINVFGEGLFKVLVGLVLTLFLVLGHIISRALSRQYGHISKSRMDVSGASIYFWLLVFNLFLGNLSDRPVWDDLLNWVEQPGLVLHQLILRVVETSTFFLQFCMLRIAQSCPLELIHPPFQLGFLVKTIMHRLRSRQMPTRKMILNWTQPEDTPLHRVPAQTMVVFFLGSMYCVVAPFFLPVCGIFFSLFYLFFKHNLVYHYMQPYISGQTLWPWLVTKTFSCLIISQVVLMLGLPTLAKQSNWYLRLALLPLPFVSFMQINRTYEILQEARKVPVHKENDGVDQEDIDNQGVVTETLQNIKTVGRIFKGVNRTTSVVDRNKNLNTSQQAAAMEVRQRVAEGSWRSYQPINLWPNLSERAAASLIIKRWRQNKAKMDAKKKDHLKKM